MTEFSFNPFPVLHTERLCLRELRASDAEPVFTLRSDETVNAFIDRPRAVSLGDALAFISKIEGIVKENKGVYWAITRKEKDELIGTITFWNLSNEKRTAEIGFEILPAWSGKSYAKEAAEAVIEYGFKTMRLQSISAWTHTGNRKSIRLLELLNFTNTGPSPDGKELIYLRRASTVI